MNSSGLKKKGFPLKEKWGEEGLQFGWTALPISILLLQRRLNITPLTLNVLLHLLAQWRDVGENPYPSQSHIAEKIGISVRSVQREINSLRRNGLLKVVRTSVHDPKYFGRNIYDLNPLVVKLRELSATLSDEIKFKKKNSGGYLGNESSTAFDSEFLLHGI